jgi:hypothetical protein
LIRLEKPALELKTYHKKNVYKWGLVRDGKTKAHEVTQKKKKKEKWEKMDGQCFYLFLEYMFFFFFRIEKKIVKKYN